MTSTGPRTRGGKRGKNIAEQDMDRKRNQTKVAKSISFLSDQGDNQYSFLIKPVKVNYTKYSEQITNILKFNRDVAAKTEEEINTDQTLKSRANAEAQTTLDLISKDFKAKLLTSQDVQTDTFICLPLPTQIPPDSLNVSYSLDNLGIAGAGYNFGNAVDQAFGDGGSLAEPTTSAGAYLVRTLLQNIDSVRGLSTLALGNIANPFSANIFEKVEPRTFRLDWQMLQPKNKEEADNLREIINLLRYFALPEPDGLLLKTPHEFELAFLGTDYLYSFSRCVLANIEVNHSPHGFNVFTTADAPQAISLTLSFVEIFPLSKETILNSVGLSMKPTKLNMFDSQDSSGTDAVSETAVANSQQETENQINQQVADWKAKRAELTKLEQERDTILRSREPDPNRLANVNARITQTKVNMNLIATEVQSLQAKINYTTKSGKKLKPLPFV